MFPTHQPRVRSSCAPTRSADREWPRSAAVFWRASCGRLACGAAIGLLSAIPHPALAWLGPEIAAAPADPAPSPVVLWSEHFSGPVDWGDPEKHSPAQLARVYSIRREGPLSFLHAFHNGADPSPPRAMHYGKAFPNRAVPLERVTSFRWKWRARVHPRVTDDPWLDMAAGIYVVMKAPSLFSSGRGFKFGWLAKNGPTGTTQGGLLQVPMRSDPASERWASESVNLCALYRRAFGPCEGEQVLYVGVTTDGDGTHSLAEGDYADFEMSGPP